MKITTLLLGLLFCINSFAQQKGWVTELNSHKKNISGVQLYFYNASPTCSDTGGLFTLRFKGKKGNMLVYQQIYKNGYEIVNEKELETAQLNKQKLKIILCESGKVAQMKNDYYDLIVQTINAEYNQKSRELGKQKKTTLVVQMANATKQDKLNVERDNVEKNATQLAEQFARTNFDDVSDLYQRAFEQFKENNIDKAIELLSEKDWILEAQKVIQNKTKNSWINRLFSKQNHNNILYYDTLIKNIKLKTVFYTLQLEYEKADSLYQKLWLLDTTNLTNTIDYADFLRENRQYDKALLWYDKLLKMKLQDWQKGLVYFNKGSIYEDNIENNTNEDIDVFSLAFSNYEQAKKIYEELHQNAKNNLFYATLLAGSYSKFGDIYTTQENWNKALEFYTLESNLYRELNAANPKNETVKNNLVVSYRNLGYFYQTRGSLNKSLPYYILAAQLYKEIYEANPLRKDMKNDLAISYQYLGNVYQQLGNLDKALNYFTFCSILEKELYKSYPEDGDIKSNLASSYQYLGNICQMQGNFNKALEYFILYNQFCKELYEQYPEVKDTKDGLAVSYLKLGDICQAQGKLDKAIEYYTLNSTIAKELYDESSDNETFTFSLATSHCLLGWVYEKKKDTKTAQQQYVLALPILETLCKQTHIPEYTNQLKWLKDAILRTK